MAVAVVDVQVRSSDAVKELQRVNNTSNQLNQTITNTNGKLRDASGRFVKLGEAAQQSRRKVGLLQNAVKNLASQLVVADLARRFFKGFEPKVEETKPLISDDEGDENEEEEAKLVEFSHPNFQKR